MISSVSRREDLPGAKATQQSHRVPVESLNGAAVGCIGRRDSDIVCVFLGTSFNTVPHAIEHLPGSVADGCWVKNSWNDGWTRLRVFTLPIVIPGLSLSLRPTVSKAL